MIIRRKDAEHVAVVTCGANRRVYDCWVGERVREVHLRVMPQMGRNSGQRIWPGMHSYGYGHAYAATTCENGHRREVATWLCWESDLKFKSIRLSDLPE